MPVKVPCTTQVNQKIDEGNEEMIFPGGLPYIDITEEFTIEHHLSQVISSGRVNGK